MKPKVSVIMLAYNIGKYVEVAIKSVIRQQTDYPVQLVIAEDCSTDNTLEICLHYQQKYPETILLVRHEQNVGLQRNFIDAHCHCTGEYIAICDGDDYWTDKHKLRRMTDFMDEHPDFAICFHRVINYYEEDHSKSFSNGGQKQVTNIIHLAQSNFITNSSSLFRRKYYSELPGWFSQITSCDYAMHILNAQHGHIYYFKQPMAVYRKHNKGIWSETAVEKQLSTALHVRELLLEHFKENKPVYTGLLKAYTNIQLSLIRHYVSVQAEAEAQEKRNLILNHNPSLTLQKLKEMEAIHLTLKDKIKRKVFLLLKTIRKEVSKRIPLPKV